MLPRVPWGPSYARHARHTPTEVALSGRLERFFVMAFAKSKWKEHNQSTREEQLSLALWRHNQTKECLLEILIASFLAFSTECESSQGKLIWGISHYWGTDDWPVCMLLGTACRAYDRLIRASDWFANAHPSMNSLSNQHFHCFAASKVLGNQP